MKKLNSKQCYARTGLYDKLIVFLDSGKITESYEIQQKEIIKEQLKKESSKWCWMGVEREKEERKLKKLLDNFAPVKEAFDK